MIVDNCSRKDMQQALDIVNVTYQWNIKFKAGPTPLGRGATFKLGVKDCNGPGARRDKSGQRIDDACWHVHGHFFEALAGVQPNAEVYSCSDDEINLCKNSWHDQNIGTADHPLMLSQACDCHSKAQSTVDSLVQGPILFRTLSSNQVGKCPLNIFDPDHYRPDGTCRCLDR